MIVREDRNHTGFRLAQELFFFIVVVVDDDVVLVNLDCSSVGVYRCVHINLACRCSQTFCSGCGSWKSPNELSQHLHPAFDMLQAWESERDTVLFPFPKLSGCSIDFSTVDKRKREKVETGGGTCNEITLQIYRSQVMDAPALST